MKANQNSLKQLFYGEIEGEVCVTFDKDRLIKILEPPAPGDSKDVREAKEKERKAAARCNLLSCEFEVEERNGKVFVKSTVQAKIAHWTNYLNIGATKVKLPFEQDFGETGKDGKPVGLNPDEPVAIRDGNGKLHVVPARDLKTWHQYQHFTYWGSKATSVVMDAGMTLGGLASGGSAIVAWRAGTVLSGPALRTAGMATFRGTLGASGFVLNNAAAHADPSMRTLHDLRGKAMFLDIACGTAASFLGVGRSAQAMARAQSLARGIDEAFELTSPSILAAVAEPLHAVTHGEKYSKVYHWAMNGANYYFAPALSSDIIEQIRHVNKSGEPDPYDVARQYTRGGCHLENLPNGPEQLMAEHRKKGNLELFDSYVATMLQQKDLDKEADGKLKEIISKVHQLLSLQMPDELAAKDVPESHREQWLKEKDRKLESYKAELMEYFYGPAEQVAGRIASANREKRVNEAVQPGDARTLTAPDFQADRKVQAVAMAALLVLSLDAQGNLPADKPLASRQLNLPEHKMYEYRVYTTPTPTWGSGMSYRADIAGPKTALQAIRVEDVVERMKENLSADSPALRMVSGDILVKLGARKQICQAALLRGALNDPRATEDNKANAICQLGQIANGMRAVEAKVHELSPESRQKFLAHSYGNTSEDLYKELQTCAGNPHASIRLRALAAGMLLALQTTAAPDDFRRLMCLQARHYHGEKSADPQLNKTIIELKAGLESNDLAVRMRSAVVLRALSELGPFGLDGKDRFNLVMVDIAKLSAKNSASQSEGVRAISELNAESLKRLPQAARDDLREILHQPTNEHNQLLKIAIASRASEIAISEEDRNDFALALAEIINTRRRTMYAERFPLLRVAAIEALAELGATTAVPLITQRLRPPKDGEVPHNQYEPDARVRLAALNALVNKKIDAPDLDGIIRDVYFKESDAAVRARLSQVRNQTDRPLLDWRYFEERDTISAKSDQSLANSTAKSQERLMKLERPLNYEVKEINSAQISGIFVPAKEVEGRKYKRGIVISVGATMGGGATEGWVDDGPGMFPNAEYTKFWQAFDEQILKPTFNMNAHEARMDLVHLVLVNGAPLQGETERNKAVDKAVERIIDLLHQGSGVCEELFPGVAEILRDAKHVNDRTRLKLLEALQCYAKGELPASVRDRLGQIPPRVAPSAHYKYQIGQIVAAAMEADLISTNQQRDPGKEFDDRLELRKKMVEVIAEIRPPRGYLILDAIASNRHPEWVRINDEFQITARKTLADIRDSIREIWKTSPDMNGDPKQRANNLSNALFGDPEQEQKRNSYSMAKAIVQAAKGLPIRKEDPRIELILIALNCDSENVKKKPSNEIKDLIGQMIKALDGADKQVQLADRDQNGSQQVRLAAAMVVLRPENDGFSKETRDKAIDIVSKLAFEGVEYGYRRDAVAILSECSTESVVTAIRKQMSDPSEKTERARLELAQYVLSRQSDFTEQDKQAAFGIICALAFRGDDQGHRNEASKILRAQLSSKDNHAAVAALGDFVRANPHCADKKYEQVDEKNSLRNLVALHARL